MPLECEELRFSILKAMQQDPEDFTDTRLCVRDVLLAALPIVDRTYQFDGPGRQRTIQSLLASCDLHNDSFDDQPEEFVDVIRTILCP